jgi:hypothetical protein
MGIELEALRRCGVVADRPSLGDKERLMFRLSAGRDRW